jgi:hypothetical protein
MCEFDVTCIVYVDHDRVKLILNIDYAEAIFFLDDPINTIVFINLGN